MKKLHARMEVLLLFLLVGLCLITGREREWLYILPAALIHEGGHYLAALVCGVHVKGIRLDLLGARMEISGLLSYGREFFVAMGGPLMNLLSVAVTHFLMKTGVIPFGNGGTLFMYASAGLGLLNLLPVGTMDGGRMLTSAIAGIFSPECARICLGITTMLCLFGLWSLSAYALLRGAPLLSVFVFSFSLILRYASPDGVRREV